MNAIDLSVGTRFKYDGKLIKVVEGEGTMQNDCEDCVFNISDDWCGYLICGNEYRTDGKHVYFKEVE